MEHLDSFVKARNFYDKTWSPERRKVLKELEIIRDEIQRQAKIHSIGSITYSSVGLVGGGLAIAGIITAPFTFGASLGLTVAGIATGVTSGVAGVTHGAVKFGIVKKQCNNAKMNLENHDKHCKEMKSLLELLKQDIETIEASIKDYNELKTSYFGEGLKQVGGVTGVAKGVVNLVNNSKAVDVYRITGNVDEVARVLSIGTALDDIVPSALKDVSKGVTKLSTEALSVLAALGIVIDLGSLIWNAVDLSKINKGQLCSEAKKLQKVIEQMQHEYDVLTKCFS
ncbi:apolipoprotein L3-like [Crassostrea angulata]|uniref:apolipoprotein L3-like n=1 Tax=Magallana angulata TaxID=2784310 RepID=UPI0022B1DCF2|nr:apolipoprotein L3-like [Crassostrea angulata]